MRKKNRNKSRFETPSDELDLLKKVAIGGLSVFVFMGVFAAKEALFPENPAVTYSAITSAPAITATTKSYSNYNTTPIVRRKPNETKIKILGQTKAPVRKSITRNTEKQKSRYVLDGK